MKRIDTALPGVIILEPKVFSDDRGFFFESYSQRSFAECGIEATFVQANESFSAQKGTLRGLHFQNAPAAQAKLVRVARGAALDVVVDIRRGSPTYGQSVQVELTEDNKRMLFVPRGFAHGFLTLTDNVLFTYLVDALYDAAHDRSIRFDDPTLALEWPVAEPLLSAKDSAAPLLKDSDCNFVFGEI
ncbi:MAG: dTDP-4-dehydrorhamnose 3,5-epimerase [Coriobacteriia bacterium]|nr:dTDP-4-dehydrorhamnose 3,5-epimerase [Coriobacteriia bacterium]